jgi:hypothetical protein
MIALKSIPTRTKATNGQIAKCLARLRLGCTEQQIQLHLGHRIADKVEPKVETQPAWSRVHWVKPWEVRFD